MAPEQLPPDTFTLTLPPQDLETLAEVIQKYLSYATVVAQKNHAHPAYLDVLQKLYARFIGYPLLLRQYSLQLTIDELHALALAVEGYLMLLENVALPKQGREAIQQNLNRLHGELQRMLDHC
jgi:hypothetical protein